MVCPRRREVYISNTYYCDLAMQKYVLDEAYLQYVYGIPRGLLLTRRFNTDKTVWNRVSADLS